MILMSMSEISLHLQQAGDGKDEQMAVRKVLVVDDEVHIVHVVAIKLRNNGYEPITAGNGEEAYELACRENPDIIIADYMMPVMSGLELLEKLRSNEKTENIPFVLLTARNFAIEDIKQQQLQISHCITKPFSPKELLRTIEDILYQRQLVEQTA
jgi:CheY-like chemotaxis protein